jgi:hypothetical protein
MRHQYILRRMPDGPAQHAAAQQAQQAQQQQAGSMPGSYGDEGPGQARPAAPSPLPSYLTEPLPPSPTYKLAAEQFSRPLLEPQASAWREGEGAAGYPWAPAPDPAHRAQRVRDLEGCVAKCKVGRGCLAGFVGWLGWLV